MSSLHIPVGATGAEYPIMVLLVDDQPIIGEAVRRLLSQEEDIDLHFCSKPLHAIEDANQLKPTVILQDLVMPDIEGIELVRQYRANKPTENIPIIVLSTKEDAQIKGNCFSAGANDYLIKLPDKIELIARIRYHSRAYLNQLQRDEAYRALRESQKQLLASNTALIALNREMEEANRMISELARYDTLTGLVNRRVLDEELEREALRCQRQTRALTVIMLDIDNFKFVNDTFGHAMGDHVLRNLGKFFATQMRPYDLISRYGGEEFLILLSETDIDAAVEIAERIRMGLSELVILGYPDSITASFGVATMPPGESPNQLVSHADLALYRAKEKGRNRVEVYSHDAEN
jgi:two-component system chemotaxis family response regulator WspR